MKIVRPLVTLVLLATSALILLQISVRWAAEAESTDATLAQAIAFILPIGIALIAWSAFPADRSDSVAGLVTLAVALAVIGYLAAGFGLHFGSAATVSDHEQLQQLSHFFSLVRGDDGAYWGVFGLEGFFLVGDAATPAALRLFVSQLPLVASAVLVVTLGLPRRTPHVAYLATGLIVSAVTFPLAGHWVSGGGWLAHLGDTFALGHGLVDFAGSGTVFVVGGATALAAALVFGRRPDRSGDALPNRMAALPPARYPILAALGALFAVIGWIALGLANPLYRDLGSTLNWSLVTANGLAGLAGGALLAQLYSAFTAGRFDPLMGPRGALAGLVAVSAGAPFMPTWAALVTGAAAGFLLPLAIYAVDHLLNLDNGTAAVASYGLPGLWGLLAVALFADGRSGQSWNVFDGASDQGVSGLLVAPGLPPDSGQLAAQAWGGIALLALGFLLPWGLLKLVAALARLRLPRRKPRTQTDHATAASPLPTRSDPRTPVKLERGINQEDGG